jgi:hypothetical protein
MLSQMPKMCDNLFLLNFKGLFKKRRIKYIHQNLRFYQTIEQIHLMAVKKIKLCWGKQLYYLILSYTAAPSPKTTKE